MASRTAARAVDRESGDQAGRESSFSEAHVCNGALRADARRAVGEGGPPAPQHREHIGLREGRRREAEAGDGMNVPTGCSRSAP